MSWSGYSSEKQITVKRLETGQIDGGPLIKKNEVTTTCKRYATEAESQLIEELKVDV